MNNKEFISQMAAKLDMSTRETQKLVDNFISELAERLDDDTTLAIQGFGNFEVKKKLERVVVNPTTRQRMLVPPKLVLAFKPSPALKEKFK